MKVKEVMSRDVKVCMLNDNLSAAAGLMWEKDCGILPVIADDEKVVGLITDRDICMAATLQNQRLSNIAIQDVISRDIYACKPDDDIRAALKSMQEHKVRRLAVVTNDGKLAGILSMNDVILKAEEGREKKPSELSYADVVKTYKAICQHRLPLQAQAAGSV